MRSCWDYDIIAFHLRRGEFGYSRPHLLNAPYISSFIASILHARRWLCSANLFSFHWFSTFHGLYQTFSFSTSIKVWLFVFEIMNWTLLRYFYNGKNITLRGLWYVGSSHNSRYLRCREGECADPRRGTSDLWVKEPLIYIQILIWYCEAARPCHDPLLALVIGELTKAVIPFKYM